MRPALLALLAVLSFDLHAAVTGRVIDDDGKPLAGVRVRAFPAEATIAFHARLLSEKPEREPSAVAETKADGVFTLDPKAAVFDLVLDAPQRELLMITLADGDDAGVLLLRKSAKKRGRVTAGGKPVARAMVIIDRHVIRRTDAEGWYEIEEIVNRSQRALVIDRKFVFHERPSLGPRTTLDVALESVVSVRGRTLGADGEPVAGATISIGGWPLAVSGEAGAFVLPHAPATWKSIAASTGALAGTATKSGAESYDITLRPAVAISGSTRNTKDGSPVPGACVWVTSDLEGMIASCHVTDAKGAFRATGLPAGSYRLAAQHPHFRADVLPPARLVEGASLTRSLALVPLARLNGLVIDEARKPVAGAAIVSAFGAVRARTGRDGRFTIRVPERNRQSPGLFVVAKDFATTRVGPFAAEGGESKSMTITVVRGFPFRVEVRDRAGKPVVDEPLALTPWTEDTSGGNVPLPLPCPGGETLRCRTDANGVIAMRLTPAKYDLLVGGETVPAARQAAVQLDASASNMTITVDRGAAIEGRVTYSDGTAVTEASLVVQIENGESSPVESDGTFAIRNARSGVNRLQVLSALVPRGVAKEVTAPASGVVLAIPKPGRIEGKATDRATNQPLREFTVEVASESRRARPAQVQGADGIFAIENVAPGTFDVVVTAPGYTSANASNVVVEEGKTVTGVELALERGTTIVGRVTSSGEPLAGVSVNADERGRAPRAARTTVVTDANGEYTFDGAAAGEQMLRFMKQGHLPERKSVTGVAGKEVRLDVDLSRGLEVRGRVIDASGRPVAGARVRAQSSQREMMGFATVLSDTDGNFRLDGLSGTSTIAIHADKDGYLSGRVENVDVTSAPTITITLERGGSIMGRIIGVTPEELATVTVIAMSGASRATARADATGAFTLQGVPDGAVSVVGEIGAPRTRRSAPQTVQVRNGSAAPVTIEFGGGITLRGRVTRSGQPVEGANVELAATVRSSRLRNMNSIVTRDGSYEISGVEPGKYRVFVLSGEIGRVDTGEIDVAASMTHDIDLRGGALRGRVIDADTGLPIAGATLRIEQTPATGGWRREETSDSNGAFLFPVVSDGSYRIRASADRYAGATESFVIANGNTPAPLELRLQTADRFVLQVVDAQDGRPIDAFVSVRDARGETVFTGVPPRDEAGALLLSLIPGRYVAQIFSSRHVRATQELNIPGPPVRVTLTRSGRLVVLSVRTEPHSVRVMSTTGQPVSTIGALPATFESLPPGEYTVEIVDAANKVVKRVAATITPGQTTTISAD